MRVIPVLDLMAGRAVRAEGGRREGYAPVHSVLLPEERAGDALALAGAFRDRLGRDEWYVADLDAITGGAPQQALLDALAVAGGRLLVDAAVTTPRRAHDVLAHGAERVVVGLETLSSRPRSAGGGSSSASISVAASPSCFPVRRTAERRSSSCGPPSMRARARSS